MKAANIKKGVSKLKKENDRIHRYLTENDIKKTELPDASQDAALIRVADDKFTLPTKPKTGYSMPEDITVLNFQQIGQLSSLIAKWCEYYSFETTKADIDQTITKSRYEHRKALRLLSQECQAFGSAVVDRTGYAEIAKDVLEALADYELDSAIYKMKKSLYNSALKYSDVVSREQTRRQKEMEFYGMKKNK